MRPPPSLAEIAERYIRSQGAEPAFKGYRGFPGSICASPELDVVHGIPGTYELKRGDVLSIDVGVIRDGWVADAAQTIPIGPISEPADHLLDVTPRLADGRHRRGRGRKPPRRHLGRDPAHVESAGLHVIKSLVGHGIGREMHEEPQIPNDGEPGTGPELREGMTLAIEPMVNIGTDEIRMGSDHWSVYSADGSPAATSSSRSPSAPTPRILTPWHEA